MGRILVSCILLLPAALLAQTPAAGTIQANGTATIRVSPDQAQLNVSVVTQGATADEAGQQNASLANTVINALKGVLGTTGTIQTVSYSIYPRYNQTATTIAGYTATNTVQVTTSDLSIVGKLIDAANQAGAGSISGPTLGLQDPEPARQQALSKASQQALAHATAIATGLARKVGTTVSAQEMSSYAPVVVDAAAPAAASSTPIQTGTVTVTANVVVTVQLQ
jgi:uncharacterized protein YggE